MRKPDAPQQGELLGVTLGRDAAGEADEVADVVAVGGADEVVVVGADEGAVGGADEVVVAGADEVAVGDGVVVAADAVGDVPEHVAVGDDAATAADAVGDVGAHAAADADDAVGDVGEHVADGDAPQDVAANVDVESADVVLDLGAGCSVAALATPAYLDAREGAADSTSLGDLE